MYWIWFGPAVTRDGIDRDLDHMRRAHISGGVLLPVYPLSEDDPARGIRNLPFLSDGFLDVLDYAARRSREKGMTLDVTLGTGWPYGGPWITPELGARMIRMRGSGEALKPDEEVVARFGDQVVVSTPTRMQVKRPSIGDEGLVLDHYNPAALARHLEVAGEKLWQAVRARGRRSFWCDSLEVFQANWTPGFLGQFEKLRGYDLKPRLHLLFGEETEEARHVRHDFWQTLSELAAENFFRPLQEWCRRKGVELQAEPYGQPPVSLGCFRYIDPPVGEHYEWRMFNASRWASSGGRLHGRNVIGAEAWTWTGIPNRFADSLEHLKLASDMHFVSGINSFMGISYVYTPEAAGKPGWVPYWGPVVNHNQTWWPYFPLFSRYVQRVSWLLQQGRPVADVALYLPIDDAFASTPASAGLNLYFAVRDRMHGRRAPEFGLKNALEGDTPVISTIINNGYSFDGIDSATLPLGLGKYRVIVLPGLEGLPLAHLEKLAQFARGGGCVIATKRLPEVAWGWKSRQADTLRLKALVREMFQLATDERDGLRRALAACLPPDLQLEHAERDLAFVHRQLPDEDFYFVANFGTEEKTLRAKFRAPGDIIELWDPMTGAVSSGWGGWLRLDPYGSMVVRVAHKASGAAAPPPSGDLRPAPLAATWTLRAGTHPAQRLEQLVSWTAIEGLKHFSGTASYTAEIDVPARPARLVLDLGEVREIAEVSVNGRTAGVAWKRPYRVDVTVLVRPGPNTVEVKVTNLWINAVLGMPPPDYRTLHARFGARFGEPAEWKSFQPLSSGLLGPVRWMIATR